MTKFPFPLLALGGLSLGLCLSPLVAAPPVSSATHSALLASITEQQAQIAVNQAAIDAALAAVKEELRLARIFSSRSGGKVIVP